MLSARSLSPPLGDLRELAREIGPTRSSERPRRAWLAPAVSIIAVAVLVAFLALHGDEFVGAIHRALHASWYLVALGALFEAASIGGYVLLLHRVVSPTARLRLKDSYDITLAGTAATRLLPTAGLGGAALTVWALRARGMRTQEIAERLIAFMLLLYGVYMAALLASGIAVGTGLIHVTRGSALGLLGAAIALTLSTVLITLLAAPARVTRALDRLAHRPGALGASAGHVRDQLPILRAALRRGWLELRRPHPALLGAVAWWAFDIAVLGALLQAFGGSVQLPVLVLAYFLGTMCNVLPLPGSLSGGLAAALVALGAPASAAIAAVLAYRAVAVWLPAGSGIASLGTLRRSVTDWRAQSAASPAAECG